jgi:hypothetical protein
MGSSISCWDRAVSLEPVSVPGARLPDQCQLSYNQVRTSLAQASTLARGLHHHSHTRFLTAGRNAALQPGDCLLLDQDIFTAQIPSGSITRTGHDRRHASGRYHFLHPFISLRRYKLEMKAHIISSPYSTHNYCYFLVHSGMAKRSLPVRVLELSFIRDYQARVHWCR